MKSALPDLRDPVLDRLVSIGKSLPTAGAVALGGSRALGTARPSSDYDILIFSEDRQRSVAALRTMPDGPDITQPNRQLSPAKLQVMGVDADIQIYGIGRCEEELAAAERGEFTREINQLRTVGWFSTERLTHIAHSLILWDATGQLTDLHKRAQSFPPALRDNLIKTLGREAWNAIRQSGKARHAREIPVILGLYSRAYSCWLVMLGAINGEYPRVDRSIYYLLNRFAALPADFEPRTALMLQAAANGEFAQAQEVALQLHHEILALAPQVS